MKRILVVGGGTYQVPLIQRIMEMGHLAYCVDKNPNSPGFKYAHAFSVLDVLDYDACLEYAKEIGIDAVLTYGATLTLPTVAYIASELGLAALPVRTALISKSKYEIKKCLFENGCNVKGTFFEMTKRDDVLNHVFNYPCVIKPSDGSGSKGVSIVYSDRELENAINYGFDSARFGSIYCEEFVSGEEYSVEAFVDNGRVYVYGIVKTTFERSNNENEGIEYGHRTPSGLSSAEEETIECEVRKAISALNITMASVNFDVILSDEDRKPYIIDCGIRIGQNLLASHIIPYSRGVSIIDNTINQALGEHIDAEPKYRKCIASRLLIFNPGIIREIKDTSEMIGNNSVIDIVLRKHVGDEQKEYHEKSDTCGWVICDGTTPDEAEASASLARKQLKKYFDIK